MTGYEAAISGTFKFQEDYEVVGVSPDEFAEQYWELFTKRNRPESIYPL